MGTIRSLRRTPMQSALSDITFNGKVFGNFFLTHNKGGTFRRAAAGAAHKFVQTNHGRSAWLVFNCALHSYPQIVKLFSFTQCSQRGQKSWGPPSTVNTARCQKGNGQGSNMFYFFLRRISCLANFEWRLKKKKTQESAIAAREIKWLIT